MTKTLTNGGDDGDGIEQGTGKGPLDGGLIWVQVSVEATRFDCTDHVVLRSNLLLLLLLLIFCRFTPISCFKIGDLWLLHVSDVVVIVTLEAHLLIDVVCKFKL